MKLKTIIASAVSAAVVSLCVPTFAYDLPHAFWALNDSYNAAMQASDYQNIAVYGGRVIDLISAEPSNEQTDNIMGSRTYDTAFASFFNGDYENAVKYFKMYLPYGEKLGWPDGVRIAENFIKQLTPRLELYKCSESEQYHYGAKSEPHGVLYGQVSENSRTDESMILLYLSYGYPAEFDWARVILDDARRSGKAIELALNFLHEGDDVRNISASDSYIAQLRNLLTEYSDVTVYMRIGAEVNIWGNQCTPEEYKNAFNIVAASFRHLPKLAVVWSIAHTDPWKSETRPYTYDDYYPGDLNVDYAGVTVYCNKFFDGREWYGIDRFNEVCFKTGYSADPVQMISDFVGKYGARKPIMISECGAAYYTGGDINSYYHEWGAQKIREIFSYIPMVYPQVKLMAYFNKKIPSEYNWYDLDSSNYLTDAYNSVTQSPWLIQNRSSNTADMFFEHIDNQLEVSGDTKVGVYPRLYGADTIKVDYYINDTWVASSSEAPYIVSLPDISGTLRVVAEGSNGNTADRYYTISAQSASPDFNTQAGLPFSDIKGLSDTQINALKSAYDNSIINGYEDGTFRPDAEITRAEFTAMICRLMGYSSDLPCTFADASKHWASNYIKSCADAGAVNGVGGNLFAPDDNVTVEQAFKIATVVTGLADSDAVYPDGFISAAAGCGMTNGLKALQYSDNLCRIDAAMIINTALEYK